MKALGQNLYWRLWREVRPYWSQVAAILVLGLLASPLALLTPLPVKIVLDSVLGTHPLPHFLRVLLPAGMVQNAGAMLAFAIMLVLLVALAAQVREFAAAWFTAVAGERLLRGFRAKLFRHVQRLSLSYHDTRGTADSLYRIQYDAACIQNIAVNGLMPFLSSAFTFLSMVWVTARINWRLALVGLGISPALVLISRAYRRRLRRQSRDLKGLESSALSVVQEVLGAARVVKAFGQEEREGRRFVDRSNEGMRARLRQVVTAGSYGCLIGLVAALGMAAVLYIGVQDIKAARMTTGDLWLVMIYLAQLYAPLKTISKKIVSMQNNLAGAERAFALLDEAPEVAERPGALPLARARGAVEFHGVSFGYEPALPVLREVSFAAEPGACLGLVGTTGAGKTTLVNLLCRFYDPSAGEIRLDGQDLRDYRLADLRRQFGIVLQEPVLFSTSIGENIAYACAGADEARIVAAAKAANAHEFISRLPQGYATPVGERGWKLSGGERQRISIARAFLKDAPILILDEPTSSVDVKTEAVIVEAMERLMRGRTTFIIAHRSSALKSCHRILRLEAGRIVGFKPDGDAAASEPPEPAVTR